MIRGGIPLATLISIAESVAADCAPSLPARLPMLRMTKHGSISLGSAKSQAKVTGTGHTLLGSRSGELFMSESLGDFSGSSFQSAGSESPVQAMSPRSKEEFEAEAQAIQNILRQVW